MSDRQGGGMGWRDLLWRWKLLVGGEDDWWLWKVMRTQGGHMQATQRDDEEPAAPRLCPKPSLSVLHMGQPRRKGLLWLLVRGPRMGKALGPCCAGAGLELVPRSSRPQSLMFF